MLAAAVVVVSCLASRATAEGTALQGELYHSDDCFGGAACWAKLQKRCCVHTVQLRFQTGPRQFFHQCCGDANTSSDGNSGGDVSHSLYTDRTSH